MYCYSCVTPPSPFPRESFIVTVKMSLTGGGGEGLWSTGYVMSLTMLRQNSIFDDKILAFRISATATSMIIRSVGRRLLSAGTHYILKIFFFFLSIVVVVLLHWYRETRITKHTRESRESARFGHYTRTV